MNRLILLVESRIRGDVYVRFGGELPKTHRSNTAGRWMLSLPLPPHLYRKDACKVLLIPKLLNKPYSYTCKIVEWKKFGENLIFEKTFKSNPEKEDEYEVW